MDHIKVYHDVAYTMYLRNVLDAWGYHFRPARDENPRVIDDENGTNKAEWKDDEGGERQIISPTAEVKSKKVRMLKGAILVLVDESSNGVLLS